MAVVVPARTLKCGLEYPSRLTYQGWEPGGTYTKQVVLKNVNIKSQKIRYKISGNRFFSASYPQPVVLSAGNSHSIPIVFKPVDKNEYKDHLEVHTSDGVISVPLQAVTPLARLSLPEKLKLKLCGVQQSTTANFTLTNTSGVATEFRWECDSPFKITPPSGSLAPKQLCKMTATFSPLAARVFRVRAVCHYGESFGHNQTILLEGIGKFAYVHVMVKGQQNNNRQHDWVTVDFGNIPIGQRSRRTITITNPTTIPTVVNIQPVDTTNKLRQSVFSFSLTEAYLPAQSSCIMKVWFAPSGIVTPSVAKFSVSAVGGMACSFLHLTGSAIGPSVVLDKTCVSFGRLECGEHCSATLRMTNSSPASTIFQFLLDPEGVFHMDVISGQLGGGESQLIVFYFSPTNPIPYHKRVTCLLLHQEPLMVHFIGSGYTETVRPALVSPIHVAAHQSHIHSGLTAVPPEHLQECLKKGTLKMEESGTLLLTEEFESPSGEDLPAVPAKLVGFPRYLQQCTQGEEDFVSICGNNLSFGFVENRQMSEEKKVLVSNNTLGTVCCVWMIRDSDVFQVSPRETEIPPGVTTVFIVSFLPDKRDRFFSKTLECYVFHKVLFDYTHVDERLVTLPWCLTANAHGHSFKRPILSKLIFSSQCLVFPSTLPGKPAHITLAMKNEGDTPIMYDFTQDKSEVFDIQPTRGILHKGLQIFVLRMHSVVVGTHNNVMECSINQHPGLTQELLLTGSVESPRLVIDCEDLFFEPTCVGAESEASCNLSNPCGLPIRYSFVVKNRCGHIMQLCPASGVLQPLQTSRLSCLFAPTDAARYDAIAVATIVFEGHNVEGSTHRSRMGLGLHGEGTEGGVECHPQLIECGAITVGKSIRKTLTLLNKCKSTLNYQLIVEQVANSHEEKAANATGEQTRVVELHRSSGELKALSYETIYLTIRPYQMAHYRSVIKCKLILPCKDQAEKAGSCSQYQPLCEVTISGAYPSLTVLDALGGDEAVGLSKSQIWQLLSIDKLNRYLSEDPSPIELRYSISTRHSITRRVPVLTRAVLEFLFSAAPASAGRRSSYYLLLGNPGSVPTHWRFRFPKDMYLEPEYWAETGCLDEVERHELDVVSNSMFSVEPQQGTLAPGERSLVCFSYSHARQGSSRLPTLLKISRGREILLNFTGVTSSPGSPFVQLLSTVHHFRPVLIGSEASPRQVYELFNAGDTPVSYSIDCAPLEELRKSNYMMDVLRCLEPKGDLPARTVLPIHFVFSPLEARVYSVCLPICFSDGNSVIITFKGEGVTASDMSTFLLERGQSYIPNSSLMALPGQLGELSQDRLCLGDVPLFSIIRRVVFLRNPTDFTLSFSWQLDSVDIRDVLQVHPQCGLLKPGEYTACRLIFHSVGAPAIYDLDVTCQLMNENRRMEYEEKKRSWDTRREEAKHTFTIAQSDKKPTHKERRCLADARKVGMLYEDWQRKDLSIKSKCRPRQRRCNIDQEPIPPTLSLLHLGIVAHTHCIPDYQLLHDDLHSFHIDYQSLMAGVELGVRESKDDEGAIVSSTLSQVIKELLDDSDFTSALQSISKEPVPYFSQFTSQPPLPQPTVLLDAKDDTAQRSDIASRHVYAAGLKDIPSLGLDSVCPQSEDESTLPEVHFASSDDSLSLTDIPPLFCLDHEDNDGERMKRLPELHNSIESTTENTLLNLVREVAAGELNLCTKLYTIAQPPQSIDN